MAEKGGISLCLEPAAKAVFNPEHKKSPFFLVGLDPRVKLVAGFIFLALLVSLRELPVLALAAVVVAGIAWFCGISFRHLLERLLLALPFAGFFLLVMPFTHSGGHVVVSFLGQQITLEGLVAAAVVGLRMLLAISFVVTLLATMSQRELWLAMVSLRIPPVIVQLFIFILRYLDVLLADLAALQLACRARGFQPGRSLLHRRTFHLLGQVLGAFFLRSVARAQMVYLALVSRGFSGQIPAGPSRELYWPQWLQGAALVGAALVLFWLDRGGLPWG